MFNLRTSSVDMRVKPRDNFITQIQDFKDNVIQYTKNIINTKNIPVRTQCKCTSNLK